MKYTIEQFELDFENAPNLEQKHDILTKAFSEIDINPITKELLSNYKIEIMDLKSDLDKEEDIRCNNDIDNGLVSLYTCIKETSGCELGNRYYLKISDLSTLNERWSEVATDEMRKIIDNMKPTTWIFLDSGIGTKKYRVVFTGDISEHFEI